MPRLLLRNGNAALWHSKDEEVFIEGPAGTGKTRATLEKLWWMADANPGVRILLTRLTRARVVRSVLVTFERDVIPKGHPCRRGPTREQRHSYKVGNGSEFIVQGAEDIESLKSQEYDFIYWNEITECPNNEPYEALHRALRSGPAPYRQLISDANPNRPNHWILRRCAKGLTRRLFTKLSDNPLYHDGTGWTHEGIAYRGRLGSRLTGVQRKRLFEGIWCATEGAVLPEYDEERHLVMPPPRDDKGRIQWSRLGIRWWFGAVDWGKSAAGVMQVWGVDGDRRLFRVAEVYRTQRTKDWWAERAVEFVAEFHTSATPFRAIVCDSAEPDSITTFNQRLVQGGWPSMAIPCKKDYAASLDILCDALAADPPRIYFVVGATRHGRDETLDERGEPCSTEEEFGGLVYPDRIDKPHRAKDEQHDPLCPDHGFDATRYAVDWAWLQDLPERIVIPKFAPGTAGAILRHAEKAKRRTRAGEARW